MKEEKLVTKIEEMDKKRYKIYLDYEFAFVLYKGELSAYQIFHEKTISEEVYRKIMEDILVKRAKKRCLNLLQKKNYTEAGLRKKLKDGYYSLEAENKAIDYVKSYGYIDDYRYTSEYVFYHKDKESQKKMEEKLRNKGINVNIIEKVFEENYAQEEAEEIELLQAKKILKKRQYDEENMDWKEKRKIYAVLARRGIRSSVIKRAMLLQDTI